MPLGDRDQNRIKGNIKIMIDSGAQESEIDSYLKDEGYSSAEEFTSPQIQAPQAAIAPKSAPTPNDFGEIRQRRRGEEALPMIGQTVGGLVGGGIGSVVGQPAIGAAVGGTLGRTTGIVEAEKAKMLREEPEKARVIQASNILGHLASVATLNPFMKDIISGVTTVAQLEPEDKVRLGKEIFKTGAIEAATGGLGEVASRIGSFVGKGILGEVLGKRVAERGAERGWKTLLNKDLYQDRVPKQIAEKTNNFFSNLSKTTGKTVSSAIKETSEKKGTAVNISSLKNNIKKYLPESGNPIDLLSSDAPKAQKNRIQMITNKVMGLKGDTRKVESLWNLRREIDKDIYEHSWSNDAMRYLQRLRGELNAPIKSASPEIAEAFERYSFVKNAEDKLYKKFEGISGLGETYAQNLEQFMSNLLSTRKDETIRLLKDLDKLNNADDKIVERVLDMAAAESLDKGIPDISVIGKIASGIFGGRKMIARGAAAAQSPVAKGLARTAGRAFPVAISESMEEE